MHSNKNKSYNKISHLHQTAKNDQLDVSNKNKSYDKTSHLHQTDKNNPLDVIGDLLHQAAKNNQLDVMRDLLAKEGVDVNAVEDKNGDTPLHLAAGSGHKEAVELLLAAGANVNAKNRNNETPLYYASQSYHIEVDKALLNKGTSFQGYHVEVAQNLLDKGADARIISKFGYTTLHWWALRGHMDMVRAVLAAGVGVNVANRYGDTALHWASKNSHGGIVMILLAAGADTSLTNNEHRTPIDLMKTPSIAHIFRNTESELKKMRNKKIGKSEISPLDIVLATETKFIHYTNEAEVCQWLQDQYGFPPVHQELQPDQFDEYKELIHDQYQTMYQTIERMNLEKGAIAKPNSQLDATQVAGRSGLGK